MWEENERHSLSRNTIKFQKLKGLTSSSRQTVGIRFKIASPTNIPLKITSRAWSRFFKQIFILTDYSAKIWNWKEMFLQKIVYTLFSTSLRPTRKRTFSFLRFFFFIFWFLATHTYRDLRNYLLKRFFVIFSFLLT